MKNLLLKMGILSMLFILMVATGCKDEDNTLQGDLYMSFFNHPDNMDVRIYSMLNDDYPILDVVPDKDGKIKCALNIGNYIVKPYAPGTYFSTTAFQISQGNTTKIIYGANNDTN